MLQHGVTAGGCPTERFGSSASPMGPPISTWIVLTEGSDTNNLRLLVLDVVVDKVPDPDGWELQQMVSLSNLPQEKVIHDGKPKLVVPVMTTATVAPRHACGGLHFLNHDSAI